MENYDNRELRKAADQLRLVVRRIFCGFFTGHWKSALPVNRLIYIFETGPEPGSLSDAGIHCPLQPGRWIFIPAFHEVRHEQNPGLRLISIHFNLELFSRLELFSGYRNLVCGDAPEQKESFLLLTEEEGSFREAVRLQSTLWSFLEHLAEQGVVPIETMRERYRLFTPLLEAFGKSPRKDFSVDDMARVMKMSRGSFVRHFTRETGEAPRTFFNRIRAAAAAHELTDPQSTLREIAVRFGFCNEFYFSRFFKRHFGQSPAEYRKNIH